MKNYLSMGFGVNSVALHLLLLEQGVDFESVFVHHGTDWPETYQYAAGFQWWLKQNGHKPVTILRPSVNTKTGGKFSNLYDWYKYQKQIPFRIGRACTSRFKVLPLLSYYKTPAFVHIGIDNDESHRAKIVSGDGIEHRYLLIENKINRAGCKEIIKNHGLPMPMKSGCYICPFQRLSQFKKLRTLHPELFCAIEKLEKRNMEFRASRGKKPVYLFKDIPLRKAIDEDQMVLFKEEEYPPCHCGL